MSRYTLFIYRPFVAALIGVLILIAGSQTLKAQSVTVDAKIDSLQILIGEQAKIQLQVSYDAKHKAIFPLLKDTIIRGVEIVDIAKPDTQYLNNKQRLLITQEYTITSFDSALYYLPPFKVTVDGKVYKSDALALKVYSIPVDTLNADQFFGPKTVMNAPIIWEDLKKAVLLFLSLLPLIGLIVFFAIRLSDNKPILRRVKVMPKLPPHQQAMKEIERIKSEKIWQKGEAKEYYTELTNTIRIYIEERFSFNAMEMTSAEIIDKLLDQSDKQSLEDLKNLFLTADLVKFAKHNPLINENDANLVNAIEFVNETKLEVPIDAKPEQTEITVEEKRSKQTKILLIAGIVLFAITIIYVVITIGMELYDLFL